MRGIACWSIQILTTACAAAVHTLNKLFTVPFRQPQQTLMQELHAGLASPKQANGSSDKKQVRLVGNLYQRQYENIAVC